MLDKHVERKSNNMLYIYNTTFKYQPKNTNFVFFERKIEIKQNLCFPSGIQGSGSR